MIIALSPSKGQSFDRQVPVATYTQPSFLNHSKQLIRELRSIQIPKLQKLMHISEKIAVLNAKRYQDFSTPFTRKNAKQALFAFQGDVYRQIPIDSYSDTDLGFAQNHLRILSGLYGVLRPLDLIQPYRLEMKTKLKTGRGDNLYQFWGESLTKKLNMAMENLKNPVLINLASKEYFKAIQPKQLKGRLITTHFKEVKDGKARIIAIFAKRARGMMAHYLIKNRVETPEQIKGFHSAGYRFSENDSNAHDWIFVRPQPTN